MRTLVVNSVVSLLTSQLIMVIGGSLGAASVNDNVRKILPELLKDFQVVHLCGKGKTDESLKGTTGYVQYEYIQDELPDLFAMADVVISRAGAKQSAKSASCINLIF